jgi:hypothetical protein
MLRAMTSGASALTVVDRGEARVRQLGRERARPPRVHDAIRRGSPDLAWTATHHDEQHAPRCDCGGGACASTWRSNCAPRAPALYCVRPMFESCSQRLLHDVVRKPRLVRQSKQAPAAAVPQFHAVALQSQRARSMQPQTLLYPRHRICVSKLADRRVVHQVRPARPLHTKGRRARDA